MSTKYKVVEIFSSINGEGPKAGELATFVRFMGCNLHCVYCDTVYANVPDAKYEELTAQEIVDRINELGNDNVTLTGGEPLLREGMADLINLILANKHSKIEIETNGSMDLTEFNKLRYSKGYKERCSFTMDYKLPASMMEGKMNLENMKHMREFDTLKFVISDENDLNKAYEIIEKYKLTGICSLYLSPVFGKVDPSFIVDYMKKKAVNGVKLQLQLHKIIWGADSKGV